MASDPYTERRAKSERRLGLIKEAYISLQQAELYTQAENLKKELEKAEVEHQKILDEL